MAELSLREQIAHELWYKNTRSKYQWEYLISTRKKVWYTKADSIINLMLAKVDKARLISIDRDVQTAYDVQLQAIKDILEEK
jgi:hypothetical protein